MTNDVLSWLQQWYSQHTDGDWEHMYGVQIETLDNPGWAIKVCLDETDLEDAVFEKISIKRSDVDWYECWVGEGDSFGEKVEQMFQSYCGALNLTEVLEIFRQWAESNTVDYERT